MKQILCDRCDLIVPKADEEKVRELSLITPEEVAGGGHIANLGDLCPKCIAELRRWFNPPRASTKRRAPNGEKA